MYTGLEGLVVQDQRAELLHFTLIVIWCFLSLYLLCLLACSNNDVDVLTPAVLLGLIS